MLLLVQGMMGVSAGWPSATLVMGKCCWCLGGHFLIEPFGEAVGS